MFSELGKTGDGCFLIKRILDLTRRHRKLSKWKSERWDWLHAHLVSYMGSPGRDQPERVIVIHAPWRRRRRKMSSPARTSRRHGAGKQQESEEESVSFLYFFPWVFLSLRHPLSSLLIHPAKVRGPLGSSLTHSGDDGFFSDSRAQTKTRNASECADLVSFKNASPAERFCSGSL